MATAEDLSAVVRLDDPAFYVGDPHPAYARLRREAPVWWCEPAGVWALSRHGDITAVAANPSLFSSAHGSFLRDVLHPQKVTERKHGFASDPPEFTAYRRLVSSAFTPRVVAELEADVRKVVLAALDGFGPHEVVDVVGALSVPTSIHVIAQLLGIPRSDWTDFTRWSDALVAGIDALPGTAVEAEVAAAVDELEAYFLDQLACRRADPRDDLLSRIAALEETTPDLQLGFARALLAAGNETTRNTLSGGVIALARHPEQLRRLADDPGLATSATEEVLRWTSVIHAFVRRATADTEIRGQRIAAGDFVALLFPAANRDEEAWPDADRFDVGRDGPSPHLAFSWGPHRCLGAHLARLEITVVLEELVRRFRSWEPAGEVVQRPSTVVDAYEEVPIAFTHT